MNWNNSGHILTGWLVLTFLNGPRNRKHAPQTLLELKERGSPYAHSQCVCRYGTLGVQKSFASIAGVARQLSYLWSQYSQHMVFSGTVWFISSSRSSKNDCSTKRNFRENSYRSLKLKLSKGDRVQRVGLSKSDNPRYGQSDLETKAWE